MREVWTGEVVKKMHLCGISRQDIADKLGYSKAYITQIINGTRNPKDGKAKIEEALKELMNERR